MKPSAAAAENHPLFTLAPVVDTRHAWAGLVLHALDDADPASLQALPGIFGQLGLGAGLAELAAIVPVRDPQRLEADFAAALPAEKIILLIPLAHCVDPATEPVLQQLRQSGFRLMADGVPEAGVRLPPSLTAVAGTVLGPGASLDRWAGPHLALGVDDATQLERCRKAGYAWFAGDYPLHPRQTKGKQNSSSRSLMLRLLAMVSSDADSREIEALLKQDTALSYHLLKLVNSVSFSLTTTITSFSHAITILGRRQLQRWVQLLLYAQQRHGDQASPLLARAARRGSMMEALADAAGGGKEDQEHAFMTGMFSLLDALFSTPLEQIVTPLHLSGDIEEGLLARGGWLGRLLYLVEQSERIPTPGLIEELESLLLTPVDYLRTQVSASAWAIQVSRDA